MITCEIDTPRKTSTCAYEAIDVNHTHTILAAQRQSFLNWMGFRQAIDHMLQKEDCTHTYTSRCSFYVTTCGSACLKDLLWYHVLCKTIRIHINRIVEGGRIVEYTSIFDACLGPI